MDIITYTVLDCAVFCLCTCIWKKCLLTGGSRKIILSFDIGSSSIRCSAYNLVNLNGQNSLMLYHVIKDESKTIRDGKGIASDIVERVDLVMENMLDKLHQDNINTIYALGFSSFVMNLIGIDKNSNIITDLLSYAANGPIYSDTVMSVSKQNDMMCRHYKRTGTIMYHPCYAYIQLLQYATKYSSTLTLVSKWVTLSSFIYSRWTGHAEWMISKSEASWTGLFNIDDMQWSDESLQLLNLSKNNFPTVGNNGCYLEVNDNALPTGDVTNNIQTSLGVLRKDLSSVLWSKLKHTKFIPGIADGMAANLGSQCSSSPSHIAVTVGTSAAVRIRTRFRDAYTKGEGGHADEKSYGLWKYRTDDTHILIGGALNDGGSLLDWLAKLITKSRLRQVILDLSESYHQALSSNSFLSSDHTNPLVLPFWSGERSSGWRYQATGCITGLHTETSPHVLCISIMEGCFSRIRDIITRIEKFDLSLNITASTACIVASGAVLENTWLWRQMLADMTGYAVVVMKPKFGEATSYGVARHVLNTLCIDISNEESYKQNVNKSGNIFGINLIDVDSVLYPRQDYHAYYCSRDILLKKLYGVAATADL